MGLTTKMLNLLSIQALLEMHLSIQFILHFFLKSIHVMNYSACLSQINIGGLGIMKIVVQPMEKPAGCI